MSGEAADEASARDSWTLKRADSAPASLHLAVPGSMLATARAERRTIFPDARLWQVPSSASALEKWMASALPNTKAFWVLGHALLCEGSASDRADYLFRILKKVGKEAGCPFDVVESTQTDMPASSFRSDSGVPVIAPSRPPLSANTAITERDVYALSDRLDAMAAALRPRFHRVVAQNPELKSKLVCALTAAANPAAMQMEGARSGAMDLLIDHFDSLGLPLEQAGARAIVEANRVPFRRWTEAAKETKRQNVRTRRAHYVSARRVDHHPRSPARTLSDACSAIETLSRRMVRFEPYAQIAGPEGDHVPLKRDGSQPVLLREPPPAPPNSPVPTPPPGRRKMLRELDLADC